jgi:hypothetical protein
MHSVASLDCDNAQIIPGTVNTVYTGNAVMPYSGGNGAEYPFPGPLVSSTGVTGLTAQIQPGTLSNGDGNLTLAITGTPSSAGVASFVVDFGGQICTLNIPVNEINPAVTSLDCNGASISGTAYINTLFNATASIAYNGENATAYASGSDIASSGVTGLVAQLQAGTLAIGNGSLLYNISGTPLSTGTASFTIDFGGQTCILKVNVIAASTNVSFGFHIQPNPVEKSILKLVFDNADTKVSSVWIVDAVGRTVMTLLHPDLSTLTNGIDVSKLPKGAYVIKVQDEMSKIAISKKFIKAN